MVVVVRLLQGFTLLTWTSMGFDCGVALSLRFTLPTTSVTVYTPFHFLMNFLFAVMGVASKWTRHLSPTANSLAWDLRL